MPIQILDSIKYLLDDRKIKTLINLIILCVCVCVCVYVCVKKYEK